MKKTSDITARVSTSWNYCGRGRHPKFLPFDIVQIKKRITHERKIANNFRGHRGHIVAVTIERDGFIRGKSRSCYRLVISERQYTKYYVRFFACGTVRGFYSHNINLIDENS